MLVRPVYSARPPSRLGLVNGNAGRAAASGGIEMWKRSRSIDYVMTSCLMLSPFWVTPLYCSWTSLNSPYCIILCVLVLINTTFLQQCLFVCSSSERLCLHSDCDHQWSDRRNRLSDASHLWPRRWVWLICLHVCLLVLALVVCAYIWHTVKSWVAIACRNVNVGKSIKKL